MKLIITSTVANCTWHMEIFTSLLYIFFLLQFSKRYFARFRRYSFCKLELCIFYLYTFVCKTVLLRVNKRITKLKILPTPQIVLLIARTFESDDPQFLARRRRICLTALAVSLSLTDGPGGRPIDSARLLCLHIRSDTRFITQTRLKRGFRHLRPGNVAFRTVHEMPAIPMSNPAFAAAERKRMRSLCLMKILTYSFWTMT